eukprot:scaffold28399_cov108-Skeletonema_menzelii.AAC.1
MRLCLTLALRSPRSNRLNPFSSPSPFSLSSKEGDSPLPPFRRMLKSDGRVGRTSKNFGEEEQRDSRWQ